MKYDPEKHHRRSIRLREYDYSQPGAYFVTICAQNRECLFGNIVNGCMVLNDDGKITDHCWLEIPIHYPYVKLDEFVIMPNHVHGIIIINDNSNVGAIHESPLQSPQQWKSSKMDKYKRQRRLMTLPKIIGRFKMISAKQINQLRQTPGINVWQRNYYEHIVRDENDLNRIRQYIANNPANWENDENNV